MYVSLVLSVLSLVASIASIAVSFWGPWGPVKRSRALLLSCVWLVVSMILAVYVKREQDAQTDLIAQHQQASKAELVSILASISGKLDGLVRMSMNGAPREQTLAEARSLARDIQMVGERVLTCEDEQIQAAFEQVQNKLMELQTALRSESARLDTPQIPPRSADPSTSVGSPATSSVNSPAQAADRPGEVPSHPEPTAAPGAVLPLLADHSQSTSSYQTVAGTQPSLIPHGRKLTGMRGLVQDASKVLFSCRLVEETGEGISDAAIGVTVIKGNARVDSATYQRTDKSGEASVGFTLGPYDGLYEFSADIGGLVWHFSAYVSGGRVSLNLLDKTLEHQ
jgi:hypothetical protein